MYVHCTISTMYIHRVVFCWNTVSWHWDENVNLIVRIARANIVKINLNEDKLIVEIGYSTCIAMLMML